MTFTDMMDKNPCKLMKMEVNLATERKENDFYIYDKKVAGGLKITEHCLVFSRRKLEREDVRVEVTPLRVASRVIYFEYECKFK